MPDSPAHRWFVEDVDHPRLSLSIAHDDEGRLACASFRPAGAGSPREHLASYDRKPAGIEIEMRVGAASAACRQLLEYLEGQRREFDLEIAPEGSDFERAAWRALCEIPYGQTRSYGEQAAALGRGPQSARAVGGANARNPIAIVIPCHRVIGADGSLTGFGGGLDTKAALLALESRQGQLFDAVAVTGVG